MNPIKRAVFLGVICSFTGNFIYASAIPKSPKIMVTKACDTNLKVAAAAREICNLDIIHDGLTENNFEKRLKNQEDRKKLLDDLTKNLDIIVPLLSHIAPDEAIFCNNEKIYPRIELTLALHYIAPCVKALQNIRHHIHPFSIADKQTLAIMAKHDLVSSEAQEAYNYLVKAAEKYTTEEESQITAICSHTEAINKHLTQAFTIRIATKWLAKLFAF